MIIYNCQEGEAKIKNKKKLKKSKKSLDKLKKIAYNKYVR